MATTVKTAISIQKELFQEVNRLAEELHVSRSKLFVLAVRDGVVKTSIYCVVCPVAILDILYV